MKMLWRIFLAILILLALVVLISFLLPGSYQVSRSTTISAKPEQVFPLLNHLPSWKKWMAWYARDPGMEITYEGVKGEGSSMAWQSETEGLGELEITESHPPNRIAYRLYFPNFDSTSQGEMVLEPVSGGTKLTWTNEGELGYNPAMRYFGLMMDRLVGPDFETGLANIKKACESQPKENQKRGDPAIPEETEINGEGTQTP